MGEAAGGRRHAVGLFNRGPEAAKVTASKADLNVNGDFTVRDLWAGTDRGKFSDDFSADVPSHGVVLIRLVPAK